MFSRLASTSERPVIEHEVSMIVKPKTWLLDITEEMANYEHGAKQVVLETGEGGCVEDYMDEFGWPLSLICAAMAELFKHDCSKWQPASMLHDGLPNWVSAPADEFLVDITKRVQLTMEAYGMTSNTEIVGIDTMGHILLLRVADNRYTSR